jgi:hypothetical protein
MSVRMEKLDSHWTNNFFKFLTLILIINIPHDVCIVDNIFMNNYTLDESTDAFIIYTATAHPDDGQSRPKLRKYIPFVHFIGFH